MQNFIQTSIRNAFIPEYTRNEQTVNFISLSGGKDSTALAILSKMLNIHARYVFADTEHESDVTYEYLDYLERTLDISIERVRTCYRDKLKQKAQNYRDGKIRGRAKDWTSHELDAYINLCENPPKNVFLQGIIYHKSAPTRLRKWCTPELKIRPIQKYITEQFDAINTQIVMWQGIRRDESRQRANYPYTDEDVLYRNIRPILDWTVQDVFDLHKKYNVNPNSLYLQGMSRVGCFPCINANKGEMKAIAQYYPNVIEKMDEYERIIAICNPHYPKPSFFHNQTCRERCAWALASRHQDIDEDEVATCSSQYGLCE